MRNSCGSRQREDQDANNQDGANVIAKRLADAKETLSHVREFDYVVLNDQFEQALHDLIIIIKSDRLKRDRQLVKYSTLLLTMLPLL